MAIPFLVAGLVLVIIGLIVPAAVALWIGVALVVVAAALYLFGYRGVGFSRTRRT